MATDVSGLDPSTVSMRDYVDGLNEKHLHEHTRDREVRHSALATLRHRQKDLERRLDERFALGDKAIEAALAAQKEAVVKSEASIDKRLEGMNEFRGQLSDQANRFVPREVVDAQIGALQTVIAQQQSALDKMEGVRQGTSSTIGYFTAGATLFISVVIVITNIVLR